MARRDAAEWFWLGVLGYCVIAFGGLAVAIIVCSILFGPLVDALFGLIIALMAAGAGLLLSWEWRDG